MKGVPPTSVRERLYRRLAEDPVTGCLLWPLSKNHHGYGQIYVEPGRTGKVHRVAWELENGPVPEGFQLDHLCRVRNCANVAHLELVSPRENQLRGQTNAAKTHCPRGHEFDLLNTYWRPDGGGRQCRACKRARDKAADVTA